MSTIAGTRGSRPKFSAIRAAVDARARSARWESLAAFVRGGGGLLIAGVARGGSGGCCQRSSSWPSAMNGPVDTRVLCRAVSATDLRHPIFRPFGALAANLGQVHFSTAWRVTGGWLGRCRAVHRRQSGAGRATRGAGSECCCSRPISIAEWNDFPSASGIRAVRRRGRSIRLGLARSWPRLRRGGSSGGSRRASWSLPRVGSDNRAIAVNVDPRESAHGRPRRPGVRGHD